VRVRVRERKYFTEIEVFVSDYLLSSEFRTSHRESVAYVGIGTNEDYDLLKIAHFEKLDWQS
jgi:hypothetical protein